MDIPVKKALYSLLTIIGMILIAGLFNSRAVHTEIEIDASADEVWQQLAAFDSYPQWNPFIIKVVGPLRPNARLDVVIRSGIGGEMAFELIVGRVAPSEEMIWLGQTLLPSLLDGEHSFRIEPLSDGRVRFINEERYSGLLLLLAFPVIRDDARQGFEIMNQALKGRVERNRVLTS